MDRYGTDWLCGRLGCEKCKGFSLLVAGEYCEIVGRVCMDQLMIRLPGHFLGNKSHIDRRR